MGGLAFTASKAGLKVALVNAFDRPFDNVVAAARSCYSPTPVTAEMASGELIDDRQKRRQAQLRRDELAYSIYEAGHHTTYQHAHFQFVIQGISRLALWSFLHAHQFYNSEQGSQRYVPVSASAVHIPPALGGHAKSFFVNAVRRAHAAYLSLAKRLEPVARAAVLRQFPALAKPVHARRLERLVRHRVQETARYVLPLATTTHLHHTISLLTLFRYYRACRQPDVPEELSTLASTMIKLVLELDPNFRKVLEEPLESLPVGLSLTVPEATPGQVAAYRREFDGRLGPLSSLLLSDPFQLRPGVAAGVRAVLSQPQTMLNDEDAIRRVLDPARNPLLAETLNLTTVDPLSRSLHHATVTFATKLSHTADSQNQRHRMVPGARPVLAAVIDDQPDYIVPGLVRQDESLLSSYQALMDQTWAAVTWMRRNGPDPALASYLLPNAVAVRVVETGDLLHFHHKMRMRLCWNAQEEIRRAAWQQAMQIAQADPLVGSFLLPPCGVRRAAGRTPYCPEGDRFCGTPVWKLSLGEQKP